MKRFKFQIVTSLFLISLLANIAVFIKVPASAAGSATFQITPASGSYNVGDEIKATVSITANDDDINAVQALVSYDSTSVSFQSISVAGSDFSETAPSGDRGDYVEVTRYLANGASVRGSDKKVATIVFRATAESASSSLSIRDGSGIASNSVNKWNESPSAVSYVITKKDIPQPAAAEENSQQPSEQTPQQNDTVAPVKSHGTPANEPVQANAYIPRAESVALQTAALPQVNENADEEGYLVAVKVINENGDALEDVTVSIDKDRDAKTDISGIASFIGVKAGEHEFSAEGSVVYGTVSESVLGDVQQFVITASDDAAALGISQTAIRVLAVSSLVLLATIGGVMLYQQGVFNRFATSTHASGSAVPSRENYQSEGNNQPIQPDTKQYNNPATPGNVFTPSTNEVTDQRAQNNDQSKGEQ